MCTIWLGSKEPLPHAYQACDRKSDLLKQKTVGTYQQ